MLEPFDHVVVDVIDRDLLPQIKSWAVKRAQFSYWNPRLALHQLWIDPSLLAEFLAVWGGSVRVRS